MASTHEESRAEHAKDTRATEQSYLARGLATRVAELQRTALALAALQLRDFESDEPIALGALVAVSDKVAASAHSQYWWIVPGAGGLELEQDELRVQTITPISPLGQALLGLEAGDEAKIRTSSGERSFEVLEVS